MPFRIEFPLRSDRQVNFYDGLGNRLKNIFDINFWHKFTKLFNLIQSISIHFLFEQNRSVRLIVGIQIFINRYFSLCKLFVEIICEETLHLFFTSHCVVTWKTELCELFQRWVIFINSILNVFAPTQNFANILGLTLLAAEIQHASQQTNTVLDDVLCVVDKWEVFIGDFSEVALKKEQNFLGCFYNSSIIDVNRMPILFENKIRFLIEYPAFS